MKKTTEKQKHSSEKKKEQKDIPIGDRTVHCKHCYKKSPENPTRWSSPKHTDESCWMLHPEKRPTSFTQRRVNNISVENTNAELVADAISQLGYNGIERPSVIRKITGEVEKE